MIVYEVDLEIDAAIEREYRAWLAAHVDEILALPGFVDATLHTRLDPPPTAGRFSVVVRYRLIDEAALERYVADDAPRLRADGLARFGGRFAASRRVLHIA
ncbi:MAG TPA: DUF4286 family protein [Tahibacter sp.]|nr:DUF4286 family protein [Tahibacter sp.]